MSALRLRIDLQVAVDPARHDLPSKRLMSRWVKSALAGRDSPAEVTVRIADVDEIAELNSSYRHKPGPTNVLSFESGLPAELRGAFLGDIVLCPEVIEREAAEQGKTLQAHWAHMLVHGTLHLLGFDHMDEADAQQMERLETDIMNTLKFSDPYQAQITV